jgi:hypothetical protein
MLHFVQPRRLNEFGMQISTFAEETIANEMSKW